VPAGPQAGRRNASGASASSASRRARNVGRGCEGARNIFGLLLHGMTGRENMQTWALERSVCEMRGGGDYSRTVALLDQWSGSRAVSQFGGIAAGPVASATMPPTMAQVVSLSPSPVTVAHKALSKWSWCRAAHQIANGTVSQQTTLEPLPRRLAAVTGDASSG